MLPAAGPGGPDSVTPPPGPDPGLKPGAMHNIAQVDIDMHNIAQVDMRNIAQVTMHWQAPAPRPGPGSPAASDGPGARSS